MDASALIPFIVNGSLAVVVLILVIGQILIPGWLYKDLKAENEELKKALEIERQRGETATAVAAATRDVLLALRSDANVPKT